MTLSDLESPFHASRAISAVAELLVCNTKLTLLVFLNKSYSLLVLSVISVRNVSLLSC